MNPFPSPRFVEAGGVRLAVHEQGAGFPVVLVHGWPEIAYSWKNQLPAIAAAGFRAIAPDLKGFGASDAPRDKTLYDIRHVADDLVRMLDAMGLEKAVFVGHDWGGLIVWPLALLHPDRVAGVVGVCTPHLAPRDKPPTTMLRERFGPMHYIVRYQEDGAPEAAYEGKEDQFFEFIFRKPAPRASWPKYIPAALDLMSRFGEFRGAPAEALVVGPADRAVYAEAYRRSGFTGGVNLYRNIDRNWEIMRSVDHVIRKPCLFVGAELDMFLPVELSEKMPKLIPDLERHVLEGCGHWVMWEKPAELNALLTGWLARRFGKLK